MTIKEFVDMYDNWNGTLCINNDKLQCVYKGAFWASGAECDVPITAKLKHIANKEVRSFGFYDNELCIRYKED